MDDILLLIFYALFISIFVFISGHIILSLVEIFTSETMRIERVDCYDNYNNRIDGLDCYQNITCGIIAKKLNKDYCYKP